MEGRRRLRGAFLIDLSRIRPDPTQPRRILDETALQELTASISRLGVLQPIAVRYIEDGNFYQIISGERRFQAATAAGLTELPCWVQAPEDREILLRQVVENWQRADLQPFELADSLARLRDANGFTQRQLAAATGKSEGDISKLLKLVELAPAVQKEAREDSTGLLSRRHLYAVTRLPGNEQQEVVTTVKREKLTADATESLVTTRLSKKPGNQKRGAPVTRVQFSTPTASVVLTFRRQSPTPAEIIGALESAKAQAADRARPLNIIRAK